MKIKNKIIMALTVLLSASGLVNSNVASVSAADAAPVNSNGISEVVADETFVRDFDRQMGTDPDDPATGYVEQSLIGAAQYFGVFANEVNFAAGTANTNFATEKFSGAQVFGTNATLVNQGSSISLFQDIYYMQSVDNILASSFKSGKSKTVVGSAVDIKNDGTHVSINGQQMGEGESISSQYYQDTAETQYVNIDEGLNQAADASIKLAKFMKADADKNETTVTNTSPYQVGGAEVSFVDENNRYIAVKDDSEKNIFVHLTAADIEADRKIVITGLDKEAAKKLIVVVDTTGETDITTKSQIIIDYSTDGDQSYDSPSLDDFVIKENNPLLWTFVNDSMSDNPTPYEGTLTIGNNWYGTILAPRAPVANNTDLRGSVIAKSFTSSGGSIWRWDWSGNVDPTKPAVPSLSVLKFDAATLKQITDPSATADMTFMLTSCNDSWGAQADPLTLDATNNWTSQLEVGNYEIFETNAPLRYATDTTKMYLKVAKDGTLSAGQDPNNLTTVSNSPDTEALTENKDAIYLDDTGNLQFFKFDQLYQPELPHTGGIGIIVFVVIGAAAVVAAGIYFTRRHNDDEA